MQRVVGNCRLELVVGDITAQALDAIVNAANSALAGGGGVDGAIHRAAGPELMQQLRQNYPQGCPVGGAVVTASGRLPARYVFHAVGPIWRGGRQGEEATLRSAYRVCLELAEELACESIAFPAISTGAYGYPLDLATQAALSELHAFLPQAQSLQLVRCVLFDEGVYGAYCRVLEAWEATED